MFNKCRGAELMDSDEGVNRLSVPDDRDRGVLE